MTHSITRLTGAASIGLFCIATTASAQYVNGNAVADVTMSADVMVFYPATGPGKVDATGTMALEFTGADSGDVDLMITEMSLTGTVNAAVLGGTHPLNIDADLTNATRSNNAGQLVGTPATGGFDLYFSFTIPNMALGFSALNQDNGLRPEPARLNADFVTSLGEGTYTLNQNRGGYNGNPAGTGQLFITQGPDGAGVTLVQVIGMQITVSNAQLLSEAPHLTQALSRRGHAAAGAFDIQVPLDAPALEPRLNGAQPQMVLDFDDQIAPATCADLTVTNGACGGVTLVNGNRLVVDLTADQNACVTITLDNVTSAGGVALEGDNEVSLVSWPGNVNGDASVNVLDMQAVKLELFEPVDSTRFRADVNADGSINVLDMQAVKLNLFASAPTCP